MTQDDGDKNRRVAASKDDSTINTVASDNVVTTNQLLSVSKTPLPQFGGVDVVEFSVLTPEAWQYVSTFSNAWVNFNATGAARTAYYKRYDGTVELKIALKNGTIGLAAFTLPTSFWPAADVYQMAYSNGVANVVKVSSAGVVTPLTGTNAYFYANFSYLAADSRPFAPSCYPIDVATKIEKISGVCAINSSVESETKRVNGPNSIGLEWVQAKRGAYSVVRILNISGLPWGKRHKIRLLVIGG